MNKIIKIAYYLMPFIVFGIAVIKGCFEASTGSVSTNTIFLVQTTGIMFLADLNLLDK